MIPARVEIHFLMHSDVTSEDILLQNKQPDNNASFIFNIRTFRTKKIFSTGPVSFLLFFYFFDSLLHEHNFIDNMTNICQLTSTHVYSVRSDNYRMF